MFKYSLLLLFFSVSLHSQQTLLETLEHDELEREYYLFVPSSYEAGTEVPLVFNFHGRGSTANEQFAYTLLTTLAEEEGFIVVYPNGTLDDTEISFWNVGFPGPTSNVDDVGFTMAILDRLITEYSIDETRVYSTGMSNGGYFSYKLACEQSDRFAAVASVTGSVVPTELESCNPERAVPVMQIHGTADLVVPYEGSLFGAPIEDLVDFWVDVNDCDPTPAFTEVPDTNSEDGSTAEHYLYANESSGNAVELYKVIGGGHTWPGAVFIIGVTNQDISANELIWEFFKKHKLEPNIESGIENTELQTRVYPNPVGDAFQLVLEGSTQAIQVHSVQGSLIEFQGQESNSQINIDASDWIEGIYFISQLDAKGKIIRVDRLIK